MYNLGEEEVMVDESGRASIDSGRLRTSLVEAEDDRAAERP
jgi:hypothetical protein